MHWQRLRKSSSPFAPSHHSRPAVEALELRELPTVTLPTPGTPGTAKISGTTGADQFLIRLQAGNSTNIQLSDNNGASFATAALADVSNITVSGLAGTDRLTLDHSNGFVGRPGLWPVTFDGGPGFDTLLQQGNANLAGLNVTYTVGANADEGRLDTTNGTLSNSITFSQLNALIDVANAGGLTLNLNAQANVVKVERDNSVNGLSVMKLEGVDQQGRNDPIDLIVGERPAADRKVGANNTFVPITLANKTNVTVNALGGDDLFTLDHSRPVSGVSNLTLDGGAGTDRVYSDNGPRGVTRNLLGIEKNVPEGLDDAFVSELYVTRLKRAPSEAEVENWKSVIKAGHGRPGIVAAIERAVEPRTRLVRSWYEQYLGRAANGNEEQGWVKALSEGMTEELILAGIFGSQEYFSRAQTLVTTGSPNERFLQALYQALLGRAANSVEIANWLRVINTNNRGGIALTFLNSAEFRGRVIDSYYATFLQRGADPGGRTAWVTSASNLTLIREGFAASLEFYDLNHATAKAVTTTPVGISTFNGTSTSPDDKQYFLLNSVSRDGTMTITVTAPGGRFAKLRMEDALGNVIFETEPKDNRNSGTAAVRQGQQYYFRMTAQDQNAAQFAVVLRLT